MYFTSSPFNVRVLHQVRTARATMTSAGRPPYVIICLLLDEATYLSQF